MRPVEVDTVLAILAAAYPEKTLTDEETSTWERHLQSIEFDVAVTTAEAIIDHQKWFPKISEFRQVAEPITRRRAMSTPSLPPAAQDRASDKERGLAHIAEIRAQLRKETA
jgi:hypothetical protein